MVYLKRELINGFNILELASEGVSILEKKQNGILLEQWELDTLNLLADINSAKLQNQDIYEQKCLLIDEVGYCDIDSSWITALDYDE